jgi:hypothetical protein
MTLEQAIETHRELFRVELDFNPSQSRPPVAYVHYPGEGMVPDDRPLVYFVDGRYVEVPDSATQSTQVGMPMSGRMLRYLQGPAADTPWAAALKSLRAWCRREHPFHRGATVPYWRGSLCWQLVVLTVIGKPKGDGPATIEEAARILKYDNPAPVLRYALERIEQSMDDYRARAEKRAREDEGRFTIYDRPPTHHAVGGLHEQECPQCRSKSA